MGSAPSRLPPQSSVSIAPSKSQAYSADGAALMAKSYSSAYSVATPTTQWTAPTFTTSTSIPACSDSICPALNGQTCQDSSGITYGVLCNTQLSGIEITNNGKLKNRMLEPHELIDRAYTGSLDACSDTCDEFDKQFCTGVSYYQGQCVLFDSVVGTISKPGSIACLRQA